MKSLVRITMVMYISLCTLILASCVKNDSDGLINNDTEASKSYEEKFGNYTSINVDIASQYEGTLYSIYFKYPYDTEGGSLEEEPFLTAQTPISTTLKVPKDVKTLYIIGNGEMAEHSVSNIAINSNTATKATPSDDQAIFEKIKAKINSNYFPEKKNNFKGTDLYKCTDLVVTQTNLTGTFEEADVWITYISDGGFSAGNQYGKLWFYTYPTEKMNSLTINDCTFYGKDGNGKIVQIPYNTISVLSDNKTNTDKAIFWGKEENANVAKGVYTKLALGRFQKGLNIGFVFKGSNERCQFTTPQLNLSTDSHKYIGTKITYKDGSGSFTPTQAVSNGFLCHMLSSDYEVSVLGMENRTPNHKSYDGDYNDMLCLVETNPLSILPAETVTPPVQPEEYTKEKGLYLFEDNYPNEGDFDFNDVVVEYEITSYLNASGNKRDARVKLLAYGSAFHNEFGFKCGGKYIPIFKNINGHLNVSEQYQKEKEIELNQQFDEAIRPYLNNGNGYIIDESYKTSTYPYVLIIPSTNNASATFRWCKENKRLDAAYNFTVPVQEGWYLTPKDTTLVVTR